MDYPILIDKEASGVPGTCVIGLQWGDEAKGKIVDLLTCEHDIVVRYQGGANAGHTVVHGDQKYKLSLLPSGVLTPGVTCVITGGVVFNPARAIEELDELAARGVAGPRQPEAQRSRARDLPLALRRRSGDGREHQRRREHRHHAARHRPLLPRQGRPLVRPAAGRPVPADVSRAGRAHHAGEEHGARGDVSRPASSSRSTPTAIYEQYRGFAERLKPYVDDTTAYLLDAAEQGKRILFEGAQGALLDVDHGTYPFVTSSNSSGVGVSNGSGVPGKYLNRVIGVVKAYSTRVGGGPFPDGAGQRHRPAHSRSGQRVRHGDQAPAALRLARRGGDPLHRRG